MIPHVTDEIKNWIREQSQVIVRPGGRKPEIFLIEVGGTVGDIEST